MVAKLIFKYGMAKVAPKVIGVIVSSIAVSGIEVGSYKIISDINYRYNKKTKDDTQERMIRGYKNSCEARDMINKQNVSFNE